VIKIVGLGQSGSGPLSFLSIIEPSLLPASVFFCNKRQNRIQHFAGFVYQEDDLGLANQMIRVTVSGLGFEASWASLQMPGWNEARLAELQEQWERLVFLEKMPRTIEMIVPEIGLVTVYCPLTTTGAGSSVVESRVIKKVGPGKFAWTS
jgi:hypothetical protein